MSPSAERLPGAGLRRPAAPEAGALAYDPGAGARAAEPERAETWKRSQLVPNSSRVAVGDSEELELRAMQTSVRIDGYRARVVIDYLYANPHERQLEGTFQLRLPEEATPYFFAFGETRFAARDPQPPVLTIATSEDDPQQIVAQRREAWLAPKEARIVPRDTAVVAYTQTVQRRVDPALMEWAGGGVFTARVYPLAPRKLHRIVVGYDVDLVRIADDLEYRFDVPDQVPSSVVDLSIASGGRVSALPAVAAREQGGRKLYRFEHAPGAQDRTIAIRIAGAGSPLLAGTDAAGAFFATLATPKLPKTPAASAEAAVFLVDTSLSSNPDRFNVWLKVLRATLDGNRDSLKRFNVVFFSVDAHWYRPHFVDNTPANVDALLAFADTLALEGATDLGGALATAAAANPGSVFDVFLLSDGAATWGESNLHVLGRVLRGGSRRAGSLFAYQTGLAGGDGATLAHLARETGGAVFSITGEAEVARVATAHRARPWELVEATIAGGADVMLAGRPATLFPDQAVIAVGRGELAPGAELVLVVQQGARRERVVTKLGAPLTSPLAARAYGQVATARLEELDGANEQVARAYATHFRIAGRTCSLLMLESEADYERFGIRPDDDAYVVKSTPAAKLFADTLQQTHATLGDPKAAFLAMLARLEKTPGAKVAPPASYLAALRQMPAEAFAVPAQPLSTSVRAKADVDPRLLPRLAKHELDYDQITVESNARAKRSSGDALKALSSLVEHNPGDAVLARDVGYSALELGQRQQAYHLFRRVAEIRPHEPQTYRAMAQALAALGRHDLALAYYEIPLFGTWDPKYGDLRNIVELDYVRFLRKLVQSESTTVADYARTRLAALRSSIGMDRADLVVTITWNTDNTDVDLHVLEPGGEDCHYAHPQTRAGGRITRDVTRGYGPEMYVMRNAPKGRYAVRTKFYASDANRTSARSKVYVTIVENWGQRDERAREAVVTLSQAKELQHITTLER